MAYWDMAVDIAVENIILELNLPAASLSKDGEIRDQIRKIKKWVPELTAEKIYRVNRKRIYRRGEKTYGDRGSDDPRKKRDI